jgi:hypothetical protein
MACFVVIACACSRLEPKAATRARQSPAAKPVTTEVSLTDRARLLAGMLPEQPDRFTAVTGTEAWRAWHKELDGEWGKAATARFAPMTDWSKRHLDASARGCETLLYPFSGPDILNAVVLFPDCHRYVLFGLEHVGTLPAVERLPADRVARLIDETRQALGDLLTRNYSITRHMMKDMAAQELHGNFPMLAVFLARLDAKIVSAREMEIAEDATLRVPSGSQASRKAAPALEIVFERPGHAAQTLVYFRAQAEDPAIRQRTGVLPFLQRQAPFVTFLKSASYLMHGTQFTLVRRTLLDHSQLILQDDSGIPLRFLREPEWALTFFGRYQKPVKDFNYGYQPDLALAYGRQQVEPLTFSFGYHWETGSSTVMLAVRAVRPASNAR